MWHELRCDCRARAQAGCPFCSRIGEVLQHSYAPICLLCCSFDIEPCCLYRTIWLVLSSQLAPSPVFIPAPLSRTFLLSLSLCAVLQTKKIFWLQPFFSNLLQTQKYHADLLLLNTRTIERQVESYESSNPVSYVIMGTLSTTREALARSCLGSAPTWWFSSSGTAVTSTRYPYRGGSSFLSAPYCASSILALVLLLLDGEQLQRIHEVAPADGDSARQRIGWPFERTAGEGLNTTRVRVHSRSRSIDRGIDWCATGQEGAETPQPFEESWRKSRH